MILVINKKTDAHPPKVYADYLSKTTTVHKIQDLKRPYSRPKFLVLDYNPSFYLGQLQDFT